MDDSASGCNPLTTSTLERVMKIPENEQDGVMDVYWTMMRECETHAHNTNDAILKMWVEAWYEKYNRISGLKNKPAWLQK